MEQKQTWHTPAMILLFLQNTIETCTPTEVLNHDQGFTETVEA